MSVKVSVIVPVYNVEAYVGKCVDSILSQTYRNYELIILNDGSTDRSYDELLKYESNSHVTIVNKKNSGQSDTRYQGLLMATGDYVYFVDSDDFIEPRALEKLVEQVDKTNADVVFGRYRLVDEQGNALREQRKYSIKSLCGTDNILRDAVRFLNFKASLCIKLIRRRLLVESYVEEVRDIHLNEDIFLSVLLALHCKNVSFIDDVVYNVLQRGNSLTRSLKPELITENEKIFHYLRIYITNKGLWESCYKEYYSGYVKTVTYALSLAAVRSSSFSQFMSFYQLIGKESLYYSTELEGHKSVLTMRNRLMLFVSRNPRGFYAIIRILKSFLKY